MITSVNNGQVKNIIQLNQKTKARTLSADLKMT